MSTLIALKLRSNRLGLALAALFGWLLSFPLFGRFLAKTAGEDTLVLGLSFITMHAAGLLVLRLLPHETATARLPVRLAGGIIAALTMVYAYAHGIFIVDLLIVSVLGLAAAFLVLAWVSQLAGHTKPLYVLAVAMVGANLVFSISNMPLQMPTTGSLLLLAMLALTGAFLFRVPGENEETEKVFPKGHDLTKTIKALMAFVVAIYFIGGIWHHTFALRFSAAPLWEATIGCLIYAGAVLLFALLASRGHPGNLALYSLSALGVGLLIALLGSANPVIVLAYYVALNLGFAAADLFYWYSLWFLGKLYGTRRAFGLGLGFSLLIIVFSTLLSTLYWPGGSPPLIVIFALALLFFTLPLIFRHPFQLFNLSGIMEAATDTNNSTAVLTPPVILTPAENQVYLYLMQGASDSDMAEKLYISRHTVKFHVRNILRKLEVKNRKELLLRRYNIKL